MAQVPPALRGIAKQAGVRGDDIPVLDDLRRVGRSNTAAARRHENSAPCAPIVRVNRASGRRCRMSRAVSGDSGVHDPSPRSATICRAMSASSSCR